MAMEYLKTRRTKMLLGLGAIAVVCGLVLLFSQGPQQPKNDGPAAAFLRQEMENAKDKDPYRRILANPAAPPAFGDAVAVWQQRTDRYIVFLNEETFWESLNRTYIGSDIRDAQHYSGMVSGPSTWEMVKIMTRTRRFSKMKHDLAEARAEGLLEMLITDMQDSADNYLARMKEIEKIILAIREKYPGIFDNQGEFPQEARNELVDLLRGYTTIRLDVPEGVLDISLNGAQNGLLWNTVFLGLSEHPEAIGPLLTIASADRESDPHSEGDNFHRQFDALTGSDSSILHDFSAGNNHAIADAFDRVLVACASLEDLPPSAMQVAQEYLEWRTERNPLARPTTTVYPWEAELNPNDMIAQITGAFADPQDSSSQPSPGTDSFELPLQPGRSANQSEGVENGLTAEDNATIQQYAARFQEAYTEDK